MDPVESRPLRQFLVVAEELNFARAAERLLISAPALSRTVARLEAQLGVRLLERTTRQVALTPAGQVLVDGATPALDALDAATARAQRAANPSPELVVTVKADLDAGFLEDTLSRLADEPGAPTVRVRFCGWGEQTALLERGKADVAFVYGSYEPTGDAALDAELLIEEPQVVLLSERHPLSSRAALSPADLEASGLVRPPRGGLWRPADAPAEQTPVNDMSQLLALVELGQLVAVLPASVSARFSRAGIVERPMLEMPPAALSVVWPEASHSLATAAFVRAAGDVAARRRAERGGLRAVPAAG